MASSFSYKNAHTEMGVVVFVGEYVPFYRLSSQSQNNSRTDQQRNGTVLPLNLLNSLIFPLEKSGGGKKTELQFIITAAKLHDQPWTLWLRHLGVRHLASSPFQSEGLKKLQHTLTVQFLSNQH